MTSQILPMFGQSVERHVIIILIIKNFAFVNVLLICFHVNYYQMHHIIILSIF